MVLSLTYPGELAGEVKELVESQEACRSEICPCILVLESKLLPEGVLEIAASELVHHGVLLLNSHTVRLVRELDAYLAKRHFALFDGVLTGLVFHCKVDLACSEESHGQAEQVLLVHFDPLIVRHDVGEADGVVHFQFVGREVGPPRQVREETHADRFRLFVQGWLSPLVLLHRHEVFPFLAAHFAIGSVFLVKEAGAHQLAVLRDLVDRLTPLTHVLVLEVDLVRARVTAEAYGVGG